MAENPQQNAPGGAGEPLKIYFLPNLLTAGNLFCGFVALTKIDALTPEVIKQQAARLKRASKKTPLLLSALSGKGVTEAKRALLEIIDSSGGTTAARRRAEAPVWQP